MHQSGILTAQGFELRHEEGISNEAHIKQQIDVIGYAELVPECDQGNGHAACDRFLTKLPDQQLAQLMHGNVGGVDDPIGMLSQFAQTFALEPHTFHDRHMGQQRMRATTF